MSTARDPDTEDSGFCEECEKEYADCSCPDGTPEFGDFVCRDCGIKFGEEWSGNNELHKECGVCHWRRIYAGATVSQVKFG